jgi:ABC-type molybdenum transport system ATPase subunit/photorepair protein PhrA
MSVIRTEQLVKTYVSGRTEVHALRGIDMVVERGEFVAIMGTSGSGKSTLMNLLGCLDTPTSGSYQIDGVSVEGLDRNQLADLRNQKIGFVSRASTCCRARRHWTTWSCRCSTTGEARGSVTPTHWPQPHWRGSASATGSITSPASCPAVSSSAWPSPVRW